jgi:mRNA interferase MazF
LGRLPGEYDDWLICMISTQIRHHTPEFDEIIHEDDPDFSASGLRATSVIRVGRVAVVEAEILIGAIGEISPERLQRIKRRLADWFLAS